MKRLVTQKPETMQVRHDALRQVRLKAVNLLFEIASAHLLSAQIPSSRARSPAAHRWFDRKEIEAQVREHLTRWQALLTEDDGRASARQLLLAVLAGRLVFTPEGRTYRFAGDAAMGRVLTGVAGLATLVARPEGLEPSGYSIFPAISRGLMSLHGMQRRPPPIRLNIVELSVCRLFSLCALGVLLSAVGCSKSDDLPVTPTVGTIATLQGTVLTFALHGHDGYVPLAGVSVSIQGVSLTSGPDGTYAVSVLKPGNAILRAERSGFHTYVGQVFLEGAVTYNFILLPLSINVGG
jgi:hypothetical protein